VTRLLVVDGANVVGATPDGWWKDRAGAARRLHERLLVADTSYDEVVLVLEGRAKGGVPAGQDLHVTCIHARRDGDSCVVGVVTEAVGRGEQVTVVTADRALRGAVEHLGAGVMSPSWLLDLL
jgi:predicted RNA-binding protein with PIN domain